MPVDDRVDRGSGRDHHRRTGRRSRPSTAAGVGCGAGQPMRPLRSRLHHGACRADARHAESDARAIVEPAQYLPVRRNTADSEGDRARSRGRQPAYGFTFPAERRDECAAVGARRFVTVQQRLICSGPIFNQRLTRSDLSWWSRRCVSFGFRF